MDLTSTEKKVLAGLAALFALGLFLRFRAGPAVGPSVVSSAVPPQVRSGAVRPKKRKRAVKPAKQAAKQHPSCPIDINRATARELEKLPGIGPSSAARILRHRDGHGRFVEKSDLLKVPGMSVGLYLKIEPLVDCPP